MISVSDFKGKLNPRWVCWLVSMGEDPATFETRDENGDSRRIKDGDGSVPVACAFILWMNRQWREWAAELGFTESRNGWWPHELALAEHSHEEFDAWLRAKVGVEA